MIAKDTIELHAWRLLTRIDDERPLTLVVASFAADLMDMLTQDPAVWRIRNPLTGRARFIEDPSDACDYAERFGRPPVPLFDLEA
jgi:hypothetical protein